MRNKKKLHGFFNFVRWLLVVLLIIVGLALVFNKPIRNAFIAHQSNHYQISRVSKKQLKKIRNLKQVMTFHQSNLLVQNRFYLLKRNHIICL